MVEVEIGVLKGQCLARRIETRARLEAEIAAWERDRNAAGGSDQLDVHHREGPRQDGPGLPTANRGSQRLDQTVITSVQSY